MSQDAGLKSCVDWLIRCSLLPKDHWLATENAQLTDLFHQLKDGVLLCYLLNSLHPNAVDPKDFSQRPQMSQFLCIKNCRSFLSACKAIFKMRDEDLFDPPILFNPSLKGASKLLQTLSALSKTPVAVRSGIAPFSIDETNYYNLRTEDSVTDDVLDDDTDHSEDANDVENANGDAILDDDDDDDDVYQNNDLSDRGDHHDHHDKSIYDDLCSIQQKYLVAVQGNQPKTKRDMCIEELVETEKKYVGVLESIKSQFMKPLRDCSNLLQPNDFDKIFMGIEKLYTIHLEFKTNLLRACDKSSLMPISIPDCFVMCKENFLFYGEYCANLTDAQETVDKLCLATPSLKAKVESLEYAANEGRFRMRDLLSVPMQRVLKYHLLLKELIKNTDEGHVERNMLSKALEETQDLSLFINEVKRDHEMLSSIQMVSSSIVDLPKNTRLEEIGRLLRDGEMKVKMSSEAGVSNRHIFLFDKFMLVCKSLKGEMYSFKKAIVLKHYDLSPKISKEKGLNAITLSEKTGKDYFVILAKKEELVKQWDEVIRLAKENECPTHAHNAKHDFEMFTFDKPTICDVCRKLLRGVFYQGYKCIRSGMNVHKECLQEAQHMDGPPTGIKLPSRKPSTLLKSPKASGKVVKTVSRYSGIPSPGLGRMPLTFDVGETVNILHDDESEWIEGEVFGKRGFFPKQAVWDPEAPCNAPTFPSNVSRRQSHHYPNEHVLEEAGLSAFQWYAGYLSRDLAIKQLNPLQNGSFLVRVSDSSVNRGEYAISIKHDDKVMHMKVARDEQGKYFLGSSKKFDSIQSLVDFYEQVSLDRVYPELKSVLSTPFKLGRKPGRRVIGYCQAVYDYMATEPSHLSLRKDDRIALLSKADESKGWWKGEARTGKVGYFPVTYVREIEL